MKRCWLIFFVSLLVFKAFAQHPGISIQRATGSITIDGDMNEADWEKAEPSGDFLQYFPADTALANAQTEVRMTYDNKFVYVFARMCRLESDKYVTSSLRRDYRGEAFDGVTVVFDTFKDKTNAFLFGVNPFGVQREGLVSNGGSTSGSLSLDWDNKWFAESKVHDGYWTAEMAIPWKSIRFKEGLSSWLVNFYRIDSEKAERSVWAPVPRVFSMQSLAYNRELKWDEALQSPGPNISVIPYTATQYNRDFYMEDKAQGQLDFGGDAKIAVSSALNLDLTVNPDFSQVEVDQQVTNLDRFEIFFPEKRQFFLENADLFGDFGLETVRPFFSRRIGITVDTATGQNLQNPIYAGARLSGKINNNLRIGFLDMQAAQDKSIGLPSTNYTVATFQQKIGSRSNVGMVFVNKQAFQDSIGSAFTWDPNKFNRVAGIDLNLGTPDNVWNGKAFYHHSFDQDHLDSTFAMGASVKYNTLSWEMSTTAHNVGAHYNPEVGFVRRTDYRRLASTTYRNFYPQSGTIRSHGPGFDFDVIGNSKYGLLDYDINLLYRMKFLNTAEVNVRLRKQYTYLFDGFDPTNTGGEELPADTEYSNYLFIANFQSDTRKPFSFSLSTRSGGYFNGRRLNLTGSASYRFQPYVLYTMDFSYNNLKMPSPYTSANLFLLSNRVDVTFSRSLFWTTFVQYNSQIKNLNINSRIQWRYKPVSDIFLVYTDNYVTESFTDSEGVSFQKWDPRLRGIVLKVTYWLNL